MTVSANLSFSVTAGTLHAHPTNFRPISWSGGGGALQFEYDWDSTSVNKADLSQCYLGEVTTYYGNPGTYQYNVGIYPNVLKITYGRYFWPKPPYGQGEAQFFTKNPFTGGEGWKTANAGTLSDNHGVPPFVGPFPQSEVLVTAPQCYGFRCEVCMGTLPDDYFEVLMGGILIRRSFRPRTGLPNPTWTNEITKSGRSSSLVVSP